MDELAEFRELLRSRMRARGAQARLSEISGIPSPVLGRWRDGEGRPTDKNLKKLAPALGESYERLAKMCGYMPADAAVPEFDPIEQAIRQRITEMREAVRDTPQVMWATIIGKVFDRAIDSARDMAELLSSESAVTARDEGRVSSPGGDGNTSESADQRGLTGVKHLSFLRPLAGVTG